MTDVSEKMLFRWADLANAHAMTKDRSLEVLRSLDRGHHRKAHTIASEVRRRLSRSEFEQELRAIWIGQPPTDFPAAAIGKITRDATECFFILPPDADQDTGQVLQDLLRARRRESRPFGLWVDSREHLLCTYTPNWDVACPSLVRDCR